MKVPLLDLREQYRAIRAELDPLIREVFESQQFILGPRVQECEEAVARYCGVPFACGVSSGTDALLMALMAEGVGPGDEVVTSAYTFFATAGSIARTGATPVFADMEAGAFSIAPADLERRITARTKAVIPVHLFGQMADMPALLGLTRPKGIVVIEDACQAIGSELGGRRAGAIGEYGCFSFFPSKNLGCAGDGGAVTTGDAARAEKLRWLRNHGMNPKYYHRMIGGNFRLDDLQAVVVTVKMRRLEAWTAARQEHAARYDRLLAEAGLVERERVTPPPVVRGRHVFNQYVIRARHRDELKNWLAAKDVGTEVYYPVPLHRQECFRSLGYRDGDFPESERAAAETLALPVYPELTSAQQEYVVDSIARFYDRP